MKSEFLLAFNEICESRGLPKEDVLDALKTALVSAYRRDANVSNTQEVVAEIDPRTGEPTIYAEKEVVDSIIDGRTEVLLEVAQREHPDAQMGDVLLVDSTTEHFGRIAAQTAKQVLLQRVREAEREHLFEDFSGREGELVNGTVQSISGQHITIGLGRTEAILPKSQQVPRERYRAHDKIRVYVLEVRRTSRGPQIVVSRNHRNLLRRLLELEVPEIYNGQVEVKSIAREAGQRSKVAVFALQPGVDPVGACVGMRGVRIQSIVRELNDEKIDVIEWDPDQRSFISKALSPARVSHVFLEEHPDEGRTAIVIVPDDQLSLAIGREGQNARLAAKLTGWRIDIKSLTEAATDALNNLDHPLVDPALTSNEKFIDQVTQILEKKETGRPVTSEDYFTLDRLVREVEGRIIAHRAEAHAEIRRERAELRKQIPDIAWELDLEALDLPGRIHNLLLDNEIETVGDVMLILQIDENRLLEFRGFGETLLETLKEYVDAFEMPDVELAEEVAVVEDADDLIADIVEEEVEVEAEVESDEALDAALDQEEEVEVEDVEFAEVIEEMVDEAFEDADLDEEFEEPASDIDDLSKSIFERPVAGKPQTKKKGKIVVVTPLSDDEEEDDEEDKTGARKGRSYVYDEDAGKVVVKRKRKSGRQTSEWDNFDDELDELFD
ncbi:MAG: transcription termination factor NusA [Candidatus Promineifilaceae bacterium]